MGRIHISKNVAGVAKFGKSEGGNGVNGDIKKNSFFGASITVDGLDLKTGKVIAKKLNTGSLIDFLNTRLDTDEKINKGSWFFGIGRDDDEKILDAYKKVFPTDPMTLKADSNSVEFKITENRIKWARQKLRVGPRVPFASYEASSKIIDLYIENKERFNRSRIIQPMDKEVKEAIAILFASDALSLDSPKDYVESFFANLLENDSYKKVNDSDLKEIICLIFKMLDTQKS